MPPADRLWCTLHVRCMCAAHTLRVTLHAQVQLGYCVWRLRWEERRDEARTLLQELAMDERVPPDDRAQLTTLLADEWWS